MLRIRPAKNFGTNSGLVWLKIGYLLSGYFKYGWLKNKKKLGLYLFPHEDREIAFKF